MEKSYRNKRNNSTKGKNARSSYSHEKARNKKKGRAQKAPISGFSTLSQVSGAPLKKSFHSSIPVVMPKVLVEPDQRCTICGEKIDSIASSFSYGDGVAHFDCVLDKLKEQEPLKDGETISYLGSGTFGVCRKNEVGSYTIEKRIELESKEKYQTFKNYVESLKE